MANLDPARVAASPVADLGTISSVLYLPCPKCKVPNGQRCIQPNGSPARSAHISRRRAVKALAEGQDHG